MQARKNQKLLKKFGSLVRFARLEKGVSQEDLAELANVHRTYIGMIERGEKKCNIKHNAKCCKRFRDKTG